MPVFFTYHIVRPLRLLFLSLHRVHRDSIQVRQKDRGLKNDQRQMFSHCLWLVLKDVGRRSIRCGKGKFLVRSCGNFSAFQPKIDLKFEKGLHFFVGFNLHFIDRHQYGHSFGFHPSHGPNLPLPYRARFMYLQGGRIHQEGLVRGGNGVEKIKPLINPTVFIPELFPWKMILMKEI